MRHYLTLTAPNRVNLVHTAPRSASFERPMPKTRCDNCGQTHTGAYCPACGQPRQGRLTFRQLLGTALGPLVDLDRGLLNTLRSLTVRPGAAAREYVEGRRLPYTNPIKYCFIVITIYALAVNFLDIKIEIPGAQPRTDLEQRLFQIIHGLLAYLIFLTLYPVAALQARLFRGSGLRAAESYVFCLFVFGHVTWLSFAFAAGRWLETATGLVVLFLLQWLYLLWALHGFYGNARPPFWRSLLLVLVNFLILNVLSVLVANLIFQLGLVDFLSAMLVS